MKQFSNLTSFNLIACNKYFSNPNHMVGNARHWNYEEEKPWQQELNNIFAYQITQ